MALQTGWLIALLGCGEAARPTAPSPPPTRATLVVVTSTSGTPLDPDGYALAVDSVPLGPIADNESRSIAVSAGSHTVGMDDAWVYCAFDASGTGRVTQPVTVAAGASDTVRVTAKCAASLSNRIVFESNRFPTPEPLVGLLFFAMHADGSGVTLLSPTIVGISGRVSPDGKHVAYTRGGATQELWVMDADAGNPHMIPTTAVMPSEAAWSPDGATIAFAAIGNGEIFLIHPDGSGETVLPSDAVAGDVTPAWSPDGKTLAYSRFSGPVTGSLYTMGIDGSARTQLTSATGTTADMLPAWSPDGTKLAFVGNETGTYQLYMINRDGTGRALRSSVPGYTASPVWSPDGSKIAFAANVGNHSHIWVADADGSHPVDLTPGDFDSIDPSWAR